VHDVDLPTALELGRRLGLHMPSEIVVFAIRIAEARTFGETLTEPAAAGMLRAVDLIVREGTAMQPSARGTHGQHFLRAAQPEQEAIFYRRALGGAKRFISSNQFWTRINSVIGRGFRSSVFTIRKRVLSSEMSQPRIG
jgi:hypothetical protein